MRVVHRDTGELIADGDRSSAIIPFEGTYYMFRNALRTDGFRLDDAPGFCCYKFLYVWLDIKRKDGKVDKFLGWKY